MFQLFLGFIPINTLLTQSDHKKLDLLCLVPMITRSCPRGNNSNKCVLMRNISFYCPITLIKDYLRYLILWWHVHVFPPILMCLICIITCLSDLWCRLNVHSIARAHFICLIDWPRPTPLHPAPCFWNKLHIVGGNLGLLIS